MNASAHYARQRQTSCVGKGFRHILNNNLVAPIKRFCLQAFAQAQCGVSMHMTKQHGNTTITFTYIIFSLHKFQQQSKITCPLDFIFEVIK